MTRRRRVARWLPLAALVLVLAPLAAAVAAGGLARVAGWYLLQLAGPLLGLAVGVGTLIYAAVNKRWRSRAVQATLAASTLACLPVVWALGAVRYPASLDATTPAATVRLPADGPIRVAWGGDAVATNYHAAYPDQRWAYDLVMEPAFTGTPRLADYGCYGRPVLAPAAGTVTLARDGEPDQTPGALPAGVVRAEGNAVAIRLDETGTHLLLAHLQPGSLAVAVGDAVAEGDTLGACGNSGNTSEPHVHVHHQRQDPGGERGDFAEGLPLYFRDHGGDPMPVGGFETRDGAEVPTGAVVRHRR